MPAVGYLLGAGFEHYISAFDHWIAFLLLAFIGGKMIWEAARGGEEEPRARRRWRSKRFC